uniref:DNA-processing protein DprA n=1 Tax=uncultured Acinetobacter sp. TaxID=165433 RepID=UPI002628B573
GGLKHQRTIAVMGTGLDLTYPATHQGLRDQILQQHGTIISEFLPQTKPLQQHFPRRNRIVSGLSLGVIVAEATLFAIPGHIYSEFHQGCHQLIREGAILVDHPEQVIEDLALPTQWLSQQQATLSATASAAAHPTLPEHLLALYSQLDWVGKNMDQLASELQQETAHLTAQLMELELLGMAMQQSGLYLRCRPSQ